VWKTSKDTSQKLLLLSSGYVNTAYTVKTMNKYEQSKPGHRSCHLNRGSKMQKIRNGMSEDPFVSEDEEKSLPNSLTFFHCILNSSPSYWLRHSFAPVHLVPISATSSLYTAY